MRHPDPFKDKSLALRTFGPKQVKQPRPVELPESLAALENVSTTQAGTFLGTGRHTVINLFESGTLKGFRNGRCIRIFVASLREYVEAGGQAAGGAA